MDNSEIARALFYLAEALEASGIRDAAYRARALRTGAQAIDSLPLPAEHLLAEGRLTSVKGVGQGIARRVDELVRTGHLAEIEELATAAAPHYAPLLQVEGLGPKTAQLLYERLGLTTLNNLEAAAQSGALNELPGFGPKKVDALLAAIERARHHRGRMRLDRAEYETAGLVERLRNVAGVRRIDRAGSLRRRKETVGDVDILVAADDPPAVMHSFLSAGSVSTVLAQGATKSSVKLHSGLQVDVRVVSLESWGAALQYFTGSQDHNVTIRGLAAKRGLKVNEYGVFEVGDVRGAARKETPGRLVAGAEEEDVYTALGLPWIPPELRENRGEIEAARDGRLPPLIGLADLRGDLHTHTLETDGRATLEEMARAGRKLGHQYLAITDHSQALKFVGGLDAGRFRKQDELLRRLNREYEDEAIGFRLLHGSEADILLDGSVDLVPEVVDCIDWAIGSVHSYFHIPAADQTQRIVQAIESGYIDVLGHPTGRILGSRPPYEVNMEAVIEAAARTGVALEINSIERLDLNDEHARWAKEAGAWLIINTDAHATSQLQALPHGVDVARRGWLEAGNVLNTYPLEFLQEHRRERLARAGLL